ncbi:MAG: DinB family protein [Dehalococcoidia bacterium]
MSQRENLLAKLHEEHQGFLERLRGLTEDVASGRPAPDQWSVVEQLLHLIELERLWLGWALQVRAAPGCQVGPVRPNPPAYPQAEGRILSDALTELEETRRQTLAAIESMDEEDLQRKGKHLSFGEMSVLQLLRALYRHDRMHAQQIAGEEVSFQPRFIRQE